MGNAIIDKHIPQYQDYLPIHIREAERVLVLVVAARLRALALVLQRETSESHLSHSIDARARHPTGQTRGLKSHRQTL